MGNGYATFKLWVESGRANSRRGVRRRGACEVGDRQASNLGRKARGGASATRAGSLG